MPTDQSTDPATPTDRRRFLTRAALGGALVSAGAVASPLGGLLGAAGAQEADPQPLNTEDLILDSDFAELAAPLELAAVVIYQTALSGDALDEEWTKHARLFQSHHQEVADLLASLVSPDAPAPVADADLVSQGESALGGDQTSVLQALSDIENTLSATHLSAIGALKDSVTAKTVGQVLLTEAQQATFLGLGAGVAVAELTPAVATTDDALPLTGSGASDSTTTTAAN